MRVTIKDINGRVLTDAVGDRVTVADCIAQELAETILELPISEPAIPKLTTFMVVVSH